MYIFYNGKIIDDTELKISRDNRAFMYGDGLFETIISRQHQINLEQYHKDRIMAGMEAMNLAYPEELTVDSIFRDITQLVKESGYQSARIRLQVWRRSGGLYTPENDVCEILATCAVFKPSQESVKEKVSFSKSVQLVKTNWSDFKTISATPYVQAGIEKTQRGLDDLIILDQNGHVSECTSSNLFWKKGDTYFTPSLKTGCIAGIMRKHIITQLNKYNIAIGEGEYLPQELLDAKEVFTTNVTGIQPVFSIDKQQYQKKLSIIPLLEL